MENDDRDLLGSNRGWFPIEIHYLFWIAFLRSEDHGLVGFRYKSTYAIVKNATLAFGDNGERKGEKLFDFGKGYTDL